MSTRKPIVAGNWKMNKNIKEARELIQGILPEVQQIDAVEIIVCPPFVCLEAAKKETEGSNIKVGAKYALKAKVPSQGNFRSNAR